MRLPDCQTKEQEDYRSCASTRIDNTARFSQSSNRAARPSRSRERCALDYSNTAEAQPGCLSDDLKQGNNSRLDARLPGK
jgi:hypothetical protein